MFKSITKASWMNPIDQGYWDDWNPAWMKAIMDHIEVSTEEEVAAIMATDIDEEIDSNDYLVDPKDRSVIPYNGFSIGEIRFGHVWINNQKIPACSDRHGGGHPELLYVPMDIVANLPRPAVDPDTGLPPNTPGPGFQQDTPTLPTTPVRVSSSPHPDHQLPCLGTIQQYESEGVKHHKLVATNIFLPDSTVGITIDGGHIRIVTRVPAAPSPENPANDSNRTQCDCCHQQPEGDLHWVDTMGEEKFYYCGPCRDKLMAMPENQPKDAQAVCDECGVDCPPTAHYGTAYGHYCAKCYPGQVANLPIEDEQPVGNVTPQDLYTELFPGDDI